MLLLADADARDAALYPSASEFRLRTPYVLRAPHRVSVTALSGVLQEGRARHLRVYVNDEQVGTVPVLKGGVVKGSVAFVQRHLFRDRFQQDVKLSFSTEPTAQFAFAAEVAAR